MSKFAEILEAMDAIHPNVDHGSVRAAHARGTLCAGTFTPAPGAARLSRAAHFQVPVPVTVRLSNGSGDPGHPDTLRTEGRGMATKFYLPDGTRTDIVALSLPVFFVRNREDFLGFLHARRPGPDGKPDMGRIGEFLAAHPETARALQAIVPTFGSIPRSYATCAFNSLHAFRLGGPQGETVGRYRWEPDAGVHTIEDDTGLAFDYLQADLRERLASGTVEWTLTFRIAAEGDPHDDPTDPWEGERETVTLGHLELNRLDETRERDGDVLVFDPTRVTDGIELTDDDILHTRPEVYALSVERRSGAVRSH